MLQTLTARLCLTALLTLGFFTSTLNAVDSMDHGVVESQDLEEIHIGGIFPMSGGWSGGVGCRPAVDMALEAVNARPDILPGYKLVMMANDSKCMPGLGMNVMYELLYNKPTKLMLLTGCSSVSTFVGQAARMWNLIVLSYGSSSPALSDRKRFQTFFRTHPSATLHNPTRVKLFQKYGWNKIATIQETQEVFTSTIEDLEEIVKSKGIEIAVRTSFLTDPTNAVRNLLRQDARIIVGLFYEDMARRVFCQVYKQKLFGKKYVWFIIGWYPDNWYSKPDPMINCTADEMREAVEGHFTTEVMMLNQENVVTESGLTSQQFLDRLLKLIGDPNDTPGYPEAPLAYDAVWALALALNNTMTKLAAKGLNLDNFTYSNKEIADEIYSAMNSTKFLGVSGKVAFSSQGDRLAWTQIEQMVDGNYSKIGFYDWSSDNLSWIGNEKWIQDKPPPDRTVVKQTLRVVSDGLFFTMCGLAALGIIAGMGCLVFNITHKHRRFIKLSHPNVNNITVVGCMICLACIFLQGLDGRYVKNPAAYSALCQARAWILAIGFTLAYGSMFSKIWTIYRLTTRRKKEAKVVQSWELYLVLTVLLVIDVVVLIAWQIIDPLHWEVESFALEVPLSSDEDIKLEPQLEHCSSNNINIWLGVVFGYKGILLLFGILLAYETRSVKIKAVNDSRFVGMSIYNVVVLCIITAPVTLIISSQQDASFAFVAVAIILSSFLSMGLIFVPKILEILRNPRDGMESTALTDSIASREEEERYQRLLAENEDIKRQIAEKEEKVKELHKQLQAKTEQRARMSISKPPPETEGATRNHSAAQNNLAEIRTGRLVSVSPEHKPTGNNTAESTTEGATAPVVPSAPPISPLARETETMDETYPEAFI